MGTDVHNKTVERLATIAPAASSAGDPHASKRWSVRPIELPQRGDDRGLLVALEQDSGPPFPIKRVYYIFETQPGVVRGNHAHIMLKQLLICVSGSCTIDTETPDGQRQRQKLSGALSGLLIEGLVWREMRDFSPGAVLLVLADNVYDESDYIRDYDHFKATCASLNAFESGTGDI
jgi:dTDP-4-dehydrorhamnose 3,5-epimerase-like enzyme